MGARILKLLLLMAVWAVTACSDGSGESVTNTVSQALTMPLVRFTEIHYDNSGTDVGEAIEISGPAGMDVTGWHVLLYNGAGGAIYNTQTLSGTIPATCGTRGVLVLNFASTGIQNGSPDGMALVNANGNVVEFLSYEGTFTAIGGSANGVVSTDIGVSESGTEPAGMSLQRDGYGSWSGPLGNTFGACNDQGCSSGHSDCDGLTANGCEYANSGFASDPLNCGGCNVACSASNASVACGAGVCTITGCAFGFSDCDGLEANGCEYADSGFTSDLANCGACGRSCAPANAAGACSTGVCGVLSCDAGFVDVDGVVANGCECQKIATTDTTCDGIDDDCNGFTDDGYQADTCGQGVCESRSRCVSGSVVACSPGSASVEGPGGDTTCTDGVDNDCDGLSDAVDPDCATGADAGTAGAGGATTTTGGASNGGASNGGAANAGAANGGASNGGAANGGVSGALGTGAIPGSGGIGAGAASSGGSAGSTSTSTGGAEPTDAGADTDAALDGSTNVAGSHDSGGCGCRTTRTSNNAAGAAWASLLVITFGIRRRRALVQ